MQLTYESIAGRIDHALLSPSMTEVEMIAGCRLAAKYEVASICIKPYAIHLAVQELCDSKVKIGTVIGFPHGSNSIRCKVDETLEAIEAGASEIDMVVNFGAVLSERLDLVEKEIFEVLNVVRKKNSLLKIIFETCYLNDAQKISLCKLSNQLGVDFVKTSTGFGPNGATMEDVKLMRRECLPSIGVKASGNIKNLDTAIALSELGAKRLGMSGTAEILDELCRRLALNTRQVSRETTDQPADNWNY